MTCWSSECPHGRTAGGTGRERLPETTSSCLWFPPRYKHFKSLPESLSLEQLSLAGSGSPEEADGPAAVDGGPSKVPCRTRSLEEGANLETSPL